MNSHVIFNYTVRNIIFNCKRSFFTGERIIRASPIFRIPACFTAGRVSLLLSGRTRLWICPLRRRGEEKDGMRRRGSEREKEWEGIETRLLHQSQRIIFKAYYTKYQGLAFLRFKYAHAMKRSVRTSAWLRKFVYILILAMSFFFKLISLFWLKPMIEKGWSSDNSFVKINSILWIFIEIKETCSW